jgi:hypothetical protein
VDLSQADIVDAHCHPYRVDEALRDPEGFDTRMMLLGESFLSSSKLDPTLHPFVDSLTPDTVYGIALHRWLAERLGCEPTQKAVRAARAEAFRADPVAYATVLLQAERVVGVLADDGFPQPPIPREEFEAAIGVPVHRVARLEPWILAHRDGSFDDLVGGVEHEVTQAAGDPRCVAYKSVIAYRTGLDVTDPTPGEAGESFEHWRADAWSETRQHAKPVRDFVLRRALAVAREHDRPFHFHCGGGDPDIDLEHAGPRGLFPLLRDVQHQPVVLVHGGWPWVLEGAFVASVLPNVYLELSELIPWGWSQVEWSIEMAIGTVPAAKVLYGSDAIYEPEAFYMSARMTRAALTRVLEGFVEHEYFTAEDAGRLGRLVLGGNTLRLHGISGSG